MSGTRYIGTINVRVHCNEVLYQWGGPIGIIIRFKERSKKLGNIIVKKMCACVDIANAIQDEYVVLTTEKMNASGIALARKIIPDYKEEHYVTKINGADKEVVRFIFCKTDMFSECN